MAKKKIRRRVKVIPMMIAVAILILLIVFFIYLISLPTQNIFIVGNKHLSDQEIIDTAGLDKYPGFFQITSFQIEGRLKKHKLISKVKLSRKFFNVFEITIQEKNILFYDESKKKYIISGGQEYDTEKNIARPILINYISDVVYNDFVEEFNLLSDDLRSRISEIKYDPTVYDENRFLFIMTDANHVYINLPNMNSLKYYDDICASLEGQKGILYLDSGYGDASSFKIFE